MTYEEQRAEAKRLYEIGQPGGVWEADDECVRQYYLTRARVLDKWSWLPTTQPQTPPASGSPPVPDESRIDE